MPFDPIGAQCGAAHQLEQPLVEIEAAVARREHRARPGGEAGRSGCGASRRAPRAWSRRFRTATRSPGRATPPRRRCPSAAPRPARGFFAPAAHPTPVVERSRHLRLQPAKVARRVGDDGVHRKQPATRYDPRTASADAICFRCTYVTSSSRPSCSSLPRMGRGLAPGRHEHDVDVGSRRQRCVVGAAPRSIR